MPASKTTHPLQIVSSVSDSPPTSDHVERQSPPPSSTSLKSTPTTTSNAWLQQDCSFSFIPPLLLPLRLRSLWSWWFEFCFLAGNLQVPEVGSDKIAPFPSSHLFSYLSYLQSSAPSLRN
ncbi:unnamed protein product [Lactuca virosa]|uniref:Uncharacterized protein n=1 Tax=Lactuca virosa TaxID=75947 RepID=A0AAU9P6R9_9ASTR|nr:unnamed protein product [Lactuca virosa]